MEAVFETKLKPGSNVQAAVVVMSPDGAVRAMIGGRDFGAGEGQFNRATQARRQTGSLFKPFVFAAALQSGASPYDPVLDAPLTLYIPGSGEWTPAELHARVSRPDQPDRGAGAVGEHRHGARVRGHRPRAGARRRPGPRPHRPDGRRPRAGARRLRGDPAGDDRRLRRLPRPGGQDHALRPDRTPPQVRRHAADAGRPGRAGARPRRKGGGRARLDDEPGHRPRHRRPRPPARRPPRRRQDRHHPGRPRRLVRGLHRRLRHRRLDGLRRQHAAHRHHRRRPARRDLARDHDPRRGGPAHPPAARAAARPARRAAPRLPAPVEGVQTAVRTVVQNVLQGLFGRN